MFKSLPLLTLVAQLHAQDLSSLFDIVEQFDVLSLLPFEPSQFSCSDSDIVNCDALNDLGLDSTFVCDSDAGFCTPECSSDDDCPLLQSCDTSMGYCTASLPECSDDSDCPSELGSVCDLDTGYCTQENLDPCTSTAGCADDYVCYENSLACLPACTSDDDCSAFGLYGAACDTDSGECQVGCTSDADCLGDFANTCDTEMTGLCYHTCSTDDDCTDGLTNTCFDFGGFLSACIPGCSSDDDCSDIPGAICRNNTELGVEVDVCVLDVECQTDADCDDGISNTCYETPITSVCIFTCSSSDDCDFIPGAELECSNITSPLDGSEVSTCIIDPSCETDDDCGADGLTNHCYDAGDIGSYCVYSCESDDDCDNFEFAVDATCAPEPIFDSGIQVCQPEECSEDSDCDDGLTNTCLELDLFGFSQNTCIWTCQSDDDCELFLGTECTLTEELPGDLSTCQPAAVSCDSDSECSDGWKCNSIPGLSDFVGGQVCYPACSDYSDCQELGFDRNPCVRQSINLGIVNEAIQYCDLTQELTTAEPTPPTTAFPTWEPTVPTMEPSESPTVEPTADPTTASPTADPTVESFSAGVRQSVVVAGLCVLGAMRWM